MILVSGTKRSGTSMWMQILIAAGFPAIGEAFPMRWKENLGAANPRGFFESTLRQGIYYRTNPHPETGDFLFPADTREHVVKVFIPGLVRTDLAFIDRVLCTIRPLREYVASVRRLQAIEQAARDDDKPGAAPLAHVDPAIEWWAENFALICDVSTRRYGVHVQSYDGLLRDPAGVIGRVLAWLGRGELAPALAAVDPKLRTQDRSVHERDVGLTPEVVAACDELYARVDSGRGLDVAFVRRLNELNEGMRPRVRAAYREAREARLRARGERELRPPEPGDFDLLEGLT